MKSPVNLEAIFSEHLPVLLAGYVPRDVQKSLAQEIQAVISEGSIGIYEAGTGTGKTLAYLAPVFASDRSAIISTGTKTLQDQLFLKDIPLLQQLYPGKRVALLKGRANYVCPNRLKRNIRLHQNSRKTMAELTQIRVWQTQSDSGDLNEVLDAEDHRGLVPLITSTSDNCLGNRCPDFDECPLYRARENAAQADVVVVNHHLLFADLSASDDHVSSLLPDVSTIIVDEAHQIHDIARPFFGQRISSGQLNELCRDLRAELQVLGNDDPETLNDVAALEAAVEHLLEAVTKTQEVSFSRWLDDETSRLVHATDEVLLRLGGRLDIVSVRSDGLLQCRRRLFDIADSFAILTEHNPDDGYVHWIERQGEGAGRFAIHLTPRSIAAEMAWVIQSSHAAWVFTSATLAVGGSFELFQSELGLNDAASSVFESPFDYGSAVRGYVPPGLPLPGTDEHTESLVEAVTPFIHQNKGRTFFLFTSFRALRFAAQVLAPGGRPVFVQGTVSKTRLLEAFTTHEQSILLATQSFWEGVDVRGADLNLLIIDKLPFPNPQDPMFAAEALWCEQNSQDSFAQLSLPRTALALKQGFGRLIRQEQDKGLFILGDPRINQRSYGKTVLSNLPVFPWLSDTRQAVQWLRDINRNQED